MSHIQRHVIHCMLHLNTCIDVLVSNNLPSFCFVSAMKESGRVIPLRKTPWGVFRLGRVKSLETLGTMVVVRSLLKFLETWNVSWNLE